MNTLQRFSSFVMDLYDVHSGITVSASVDCITVNVDENEEILLWFNDGKIYPQITHYYDTHKAVDFDTLLEILKVVEKYK